MPSTTEILLRIYQICGACWEWSVPIRRHLLYRDLNAKYGNNFLCVRTTFSLCGMEARKEARKQSRRRKLERENEEMKEWTWNLGILEWRCIRCLQDLSTVIEREMFWNWVKVTFPWMRIFIDRRTLEANGNLGNHEILLRMRLQLQNEGIWETVRESGLITCWGTGYRTWECRIVEWIYCIVYCTWMWGEPPIYTLQPDTWYYKAYIQQISLLSLLWSHESR